MYAENRVEMVTLMHLESFNCGAEDRVEKITLRSLECFNLGKKTGWRWLH